MDGMEKVCQLTSNTKLINNGFSSANAAIDWGNKVKNVIKNLSQLPSNKKITITPLGSGKYALPMNASFKKC